MHKTFEDDSYSLDVHATTHIEKRKRAERWIGVVIALAVLSWLQRHLA